MEILQIKRPSAIDGLEHGWHTDHATARVMRRFGVVPARFVRCCPLVTAKLRGMQRLTTTAVVSEPFQPDMAPFYGHVQRKYELSFQ